MHSRYRVKYNLSNLDRLWRLDRPSHNKPNFKKFKQLKLQIVGWFCEIMHTIKLLQEKLLILRLFCQVVGCSIDWGCEINAHNK